MNFFLRFATIFSLVQVFGHTAYCQTNADSTKLIEKRIAQFLESSQLSTQLFLGFHYITSANQTTNEFVIKRGYLNFRKNINPYLSGRITPDITIDQEGDGEGDVEMRLKYCFMEMKHPESIGFLTNPSILVGQVYTPWIEFEEKINVYRVEGAHFLDRIKQISSADFGVTVTSLIGGKMDEDFQKRINKSHAGKYGSFAFGVYNGGGYHSLEKNCNKTLQGRLSIRPLPKYIPGFQVSVAGLMGKGNIAESPDWRMISGFLSYEHEFFVLTGQVYSATGDHQGSLIDNITMDPYKNKGHSIFTEVKLFKKKVSMVGRWDYWEISKTNLFASSRYIAGVAYHISGRNKVMVNYNFLDNNSSHTKPDDKAIEIMFELSF